MLSISLIIFFNCINYLKIKKTKVYYVQEIIKCTSISYVVIILWAMFQNGKVYLVLDITTCTSKNQNKKPKQ